MGKLFGIIFIVGVTAAATALIFRPGASPAAAQETPTETKSATPFWPGESHWSWRVATPAPRPQGDWISLRIRETSSERKKDSIIPIRGEEPVSAKDADREFGAGASGRDGGDAPLPANLTAAIQLIDLREIGAESARPGQPLRVLGRFSMGGGTSKISGEDIYLPAGQFAGHLVHHNGQHWKNGEFHLMSFLVDAETRRYRYDVVLVHTARPPAH